MGSDQVFLELTDNTAIRMYGIAVMGAAAAGAILVSRSPTVHLWMPTGEGSDHIRQRILGRAVRRRRELVRGSGRQWGIYRPRFAALAESLAGIGSATSYDIVHLPADRQIANLLDGACKLAGFDRDSVDPHWTFVLVSAYSDWSMLAVAQQILGDRVVFVLASGVRLPPGIDADAELIRRNQWLDFRDQSPVMLYELLRSVVFARPDIPSPVTVPADIKRFHGPGYLTRFLGWTQVTTAVVVVEPLGLLVANSSPLLPTLAITIVATVLIALAWRLAWRTAARQITAQRWRRHAWLIVAAFVAWALLFPPASAMPPAWRVLSSVLLRIVVPVITVSSLPSYGRNFRLLWLPPAELTGSAGMIGPARPQLFSYPLIAATVAFMAPAVFLSPLPSTP
jgi:hypothetical protein